MPEQVSRTLRAVTVFLLAFLCLMMRSAFPQGDDEHTKELATWIKANYTKYEYRIAMRDGVHLFTAVYMPKDGSSSLTYPILMQRTPYGIAPYGVDNYLKALGPSEQMARAKYIFAYQDVRGRYLSEGQFVNMRPHNPAKNSPADVDESSDTYDTIEWLVHNIPNNNGRVGMWGISYPGFYVAGGMIDAHPALKAVSPQAPIADWFIGDDFHHHGALYLPHFFNFVVTYGQPRPEPTTKGPPNFEHGTKDGYDFFKGIEPLPLANQKYLDVNVPLWNEVIQHPNYDAFWQARNLRPHIKNIKPAVLTVGGWFDAENLFGALHVYEAAQKNNPAAPVRLVMGPWYHGGWRGSDGDHLGPVSFNAKTSLFYRESIEAPFFDYYLKGRGEMNLPVAWVFETGTNAWRNYDAWPPKFVARKTLYFSANGKLLFEPPTEAGDVFDEYVSDPAKPVPFIDQTAIGMTREYMTADQRLQGRRTDVLVYQTDPLEQDTTLAGPVAPSLDVSTTGSDSDWVVKLIDVYPADAPDPVPDSADVHMSGYEELIRGEPMRGRFRNSYEKPQPFQPGKVSKVEFEMPDVNHCFRRGHRIMIQVQSSWFPLVDINPQKFVDIYTAKPGDFQKAVERVYRSRGAASHVDIWVLPKQAAAPAQ
jgi:putative CocE/NonD family hydrolase